MSIMSMFNQVLGRGPSAAPNPAALPTTFDANGNPVASNVPPSQLPANLDNMGEPQPKPAPKVEEQSPLADFKDFWKTDPKAEPQPDLSQFAFNFDATKVSDAVKKVDFTKTVTPEQIQAIAKGGEEAVTALLQVINSVGQQSMQNAIIAGAKVTETGLQSSGARIASALPDMVRKQSVSNVLREDNPLFKNPAIAPMMIAVEQQLASKFPDATPQELREQAKKYMAGFAQEAAKAFGAPTDSTGNASQPRQISETDFSSW